MTRVAIVDDGEVVREALVHLLESEPGFEVAWTAGDPDEAISSATRDTPEVILIDVRMPAGGGPRATREILREHPAVRVVAVSAYGERTTVMEMLRAGAVGYVLKGSPAEEILAAVVAASQGGTRLSPQVSGEVVQELAGRLRSEASDDRRKSEIESRVRRAVEDPDVLTMVFQPVFDIARMRIVGVEALSRFRIDPPTPADVWFAEAEEIGRRPQLELAALRRAFDLLVDLPSALFFSVNASPETILGDEFRALIATTIGARLVVEITEHAVVEDYEAIAEVTEEIRQGGGRLAVDDVGAGFASLRHILRLSPDVIKIDRSLTAGVDRDAGARALAQALIAFAAATGAVVVAEGLERQEELETMRDLGAGFGQGHHLGEPMPMADLLALLEGGSSIPPRPRVTL